MVTEFIEEHQIKLSSVKYIDAGLTQPFFDQKLAWDFAQFHNSRAQLRVIHWQENLKRGVSIIGTENRVKVYYMNTTHFLGAVRGALVHLTLANQADKDSNVRIILVTYPDTNHTASWHDQI